MRTIKFRGKKTTNDVWAYGSLVSSNNLDAAIYFQKGNSSVKSMDWVYVNPKTIGQFTGLLDRNGKEIYEGDIVRYYETRIVCINPDCDPFNFIYNEVLIEKLGVINFVDGIFCVEYESCPLCWQGFNDLEELRELLNADEENEYTDVDGNTIDETKLGIEVIGNIHDNPELINK